MLQAIRDKAQGWIAWAIVILISIPFALWGINEYLGVGGEVVYAKVGGQEITERQLSERARFLRDRLRQNLGKAYKPDQWPEKVIRQQALDQLIETTLVDQAIQDWGMRIGDEQLKAAILSDPSFQSGGRFDLGQYKNYLRLRGLSEKGFEQIMRRELLAQQLIDGISGSSFVPEPRVAEAARLQDQSRDLQFVRIANGPLAAKIQPTDAQIKAYFAKHASRYQAPERVRLAYVSLSMDTLGANITVTDKVAKAYFEEHKSQFTKGTEERRIRHILVKVKPSADEAEVSRARAKLVAAAGRIKAGDDFASVAKETSDDSLSAALGGDRGWMSKDLLTPEEAKAAFALEKGKLSDPVRSNFGWHLIEVTDIRNAAPTFESVRDEVIKAYRTAEADKIFYERSQRMANLVFEAKNSLQPAAETLGLKVEESPWLSRSGGDGVFANPKLMAAAFSPIVLDEGENSDLIEVGPTHYVAVRVLEHKQASARKLDEVRKQVTAAVRKELAGQAAKRRGEALLARLNKGEKLSDLASAESLTLEAPGSVKRDAVNLPPTLLRAAFSASRPEAGKHTVGGLSSANGDYLLYEVSNVKDGSKTDLGKQRVRLLAERIRGSLSDREYKGLIAHLRKEGDVTMVKAVGSGDDDS